MIIWFVFLTCNTFHTSRHKIIVASMSNFKFDEFWVVSLKKPRQENIFLCAWGTLSNTLGRLYCSNISTWAGIWFVITSRTHSAHFKTQLSICYCPPPTHALLQKNWSKFLLLFTLSNLFGWVCRGGGVTQCFFFFWGPKNICTCGRYSNWRVLLGKFIWATKILPRETLFCAPNLIILINVNYITILNTKKYHAETEKNCFRSKTENTSSGLSFTCAIAGFHWFRCSIIDEITYA